MFLSVKTRVSVNLLKSGADINLGVHGGGLFSLGPALLDFFQVPRTLRSSFITRILIAFGHFGKRRIRERDSMR